MIAFGNNPWGYQDYWALHASLLREADYLAIVGPGPPGRRNGSRQAKALFLTISTASDR